MSAPPKTALNAAPGEEAAIRAAVRDADVSLLGDDCAPASAEHVAGLVELLADPEVSGPIYDIPQPINTDTITSWLRNAEQKRRAGEAVLVVRMDGADRVYSYSMFSVWPERASAEIVGAFRSDMQNAGVGKAAAAQSFAWMFEALGVRLICVTAALDNARSACVIEAAGFVAGGERESVRPDGTVRRSRYWELTRNAWLAQQA